MGKIIVGVSQTESISKVIGKQGIETLLVDKKKQVISLVLDTDLEPHTPLMVTVIYKNGKPYQVLAKNELTQAEVPVSAYCLEWPEADKDIMALYWPLQQIPTMPATFQMGLFN